MPNTQLDKTKTLDQCRAKHAWECIEKIAGAGDQADEYAREARKLLTRIRACGLGQALAFVKAKAKDKTGLKTLHADIRDWVVGHRLKGSAKKPGDLLESIIEGDAEFLRRATDETLAYLQWLTRFAEAKGLPKKPQED